MTKGFYDFDFNSDDGVIAKNWGVDEVFYLRNLRSRKLYLSDDIDECIIDSVVRHILQYNADDKDIPVEERKPILLYVSSNGGSIDPGFELVDVIIESKTPVYTINLGYQYSMGFLIGLAGAKAQDQMEFNKRIEQRIKEYVLSRSKITSEEYDSKLRVEWYLFADEAKEKGFCDYIIGEDCSLDDIV